MTLCWTARFGKVSELGKVGDVRDRQGRVLDILGTIIGDQGELEPWGAFATIKSSGWVQMVGAKRGVCTRRCYEIAIQQNRIHHILNFEFERQPRVQQL